MPSQISPLNDKKRCITDQIIIFCVYYMKLCEETSNLLCKNCLMVEILILNVLWILINHFQKKTSLYFSYHDTLYK